jgi:hypothetical protein
VVLEQAQRVMVAISPIVGSARIASAAGKILRAYGVAGAIEEAEGGMTATGRVRRTAKRPVPG